MSLKSTFPIVKLSTIVFASVAIVYGLKYYDEQNKTIKLQNQIKLDKKTYTNDLKEIFNRYDNEIVKNKELTQENQLLIKEKKQSNVNELVASKPVVIKPTRYQKKYDSLNSVLKQEIEENKYLSTQVATLNEKNRELQKINYSNESVISNSKNLTAVNVVANGIKIVSNNIIETKKFSSMEQIKVCFTLLENKAAVKGSKDIYIQILNPNNKIVSKNGEALETGDRLLHYSAKTNIYYDNEEMDVCVFVDPNKADILKGDYEINIFSGITQIGSTVFTLK